MAEEELKGSVCPRCSSLIDYIERRESGGNTYLYAVHVEKEEGKRRLRKCYLGPENQYIYVSKLHTREGLDLRGLMDYERAIEYLESLKEYFRGVSLNDGKKEEIARIGMDLLEIAGLQNIASETIKIDGETLSDVMQYFMKRKTKGMTKERIERAREVFRKVFSKGIKTIVVEG
ncbi:MAG: hypothetical protein DSO07_02195 [Thermoproteota archaeon]|uniref:Uncharacterized protein n=1 Tax=Candidatus Methanodesulfokora washburnensis TaxID=2478471 RepID=A0A3R9QC54_9CREN|nr:hypothetical protein [Candidatus Methanodesulfokores washburnensis]RSN72928.1 hypothetical protein D6D85_11920 [Candidatus Methanodesulfokores washburnensis]TDA41884.1 MAG: hypothetical protein DSO07_02195 [Candidatus Korarchaeota archaeon]